MIFIFAETCLPLNSCVGFVPFPKIKSMTNSNAFDVIIVGGSYAGLSAALALGRSLRNVLVIDSGKPCNRYTRHSHNFLTQDGQTPQAIKVLGRQQVEKYKTIIFHESQAVHAVKTKDGFEIQTLEKLIMATGIKDIMPEIRGFAQCWGISVIHCPYCHGYEVMNEKTAIISNGDPGFHYAQLISNWTNELSVFTNGKATFSHVQYAKLRRNDIEIIETGIEEILHTQGKVEEVIFKDNSRLAVKVLYAGPAFEQHSGIPMELGCRLTDRGLIEVDASQKTSVSGVFACGDNSGMRAVSVAVSSGTKAGAAANFELIEEDF